MDPRIDPSTGDYSGERITTLANAVYLRLMTPLGSWWGDPTLGSRLHELERELDLARVRLLAKQYAEQALATLVKEGRARSVVVTATQARVGWCDLWVSVVDETGQEQQFQHPVKVA
ncbi:phage GP46 family protein [Achromobacter xylosoxidans]|uniref:phage GP46 family protein n=1 Tax=Alcaligenes xylosoxydans xylosoxydans TaxID=85698 RepID=UPI001F0F828C|nr:phage GP46 family protein [Achromobacter xylosoxidans]MCH4576491.1 phage GP46 family protein [Achromobacter xylosoxidans]